MDGRNGLFGTRRIAALRVLAFFALLAASVVALPLAVHAQIDTGLAGVGETIGLTTTSLPVLVGRIIYGFLGLLGIVAIVLVIYSGFIWMTAQGDAEKVKRAKAILINAVIGLIIIVCAGAITAFIINLLGRALGNGGGPGGNGPTDRWFSLSPGARGSELGNGIIEYHYPEPGQIDVPRNTRISITFKAPLGLSSVFAHYDDKGTYAIDDDQICAGNAPCNGTPVTAATVVELNTDNVRIIPTASLANAGSGSIDDQFDNRYPANASLVTPAPTARVTAVTPAFSAGQMQTIVITPDAPIGSPTANIDYRVALRGGDNGIRIWDETSDPAQAESAPAFETARADGSYYWHFETNTTIDVTSPRIVAVTPNLTRQPGVPTSSVLDRNQLLQIYFNEAVDPTTASGMIGAGGGFNLIEVRAECIPNADCDFNGGQPGVVDGTLYLGNRYRTAEFVPSAPCEGVSENSCGEPVYCLPRNVRLEVVARAATIDKEAPIDPEPPTALVDNGVVDMVGNSLDGNSDGTAQGGQSAPAGSQPLGLPQAYYRNAPQTFDTSDTTNWEYEVGSNVDLTVPILRGVDPPPPPPESAEYPIGPSRVPVTTPVTLTWSKVMSISSLRTGSFDENQGAYASPYSTLVLRSRECAKTSSQACTTAGCPCTELSPPGFFLGGLPTDNPPESMLIDDPAGAGQVTRIALLHPVSPFLTANDLGYTEEDVAVYPGSIPAYLPIARAKIKDTKQNCFWPSRYQPTTGAAECTLGPGQYSCCNRAGESDGSFLANCAPSP